MKVKCPCETDSQSCCACVSMHCDECHGHSKFVQGRFCSNCGRPLKAELTRLYVPKSEVIKALNEVELLIIITKEVYKQQTIDASNELSKQSKRTKWIAFEKFYEQFAEIKKEYIGEKEDDN